MGLPELVSAGGETGGIEMAAQGRDMMVSRFALGFAALAAALVCPPRAQAQAPAQAAVSGPAESGDMKQAVEQRIGALQAKLGISDAQLPAWTSFAQAMRDDATSTDQLFAHRAQNQETMSAVDNMKSYAAIARAYADNTEHLATAFETLYGKLSPAQQKTADDLFRQPPASSAKSPKHR
jgi:hypothetical protein